MLDLVGNPEDRFSHNEAQLHFVCFSAILQSLFQVANRAKMHGIGRHNSEEIHKIGCDDIQAISSYLGTKPYLMGDIPTIVSSNTLNLNHFEFLILACSVFILHVND